MTWWDTKIALHVSNFAFLDRNAQNDKKYPKILCRLEN